MDFFVFSHDPSVVVQRLASIAVVISSLEFLVMRKILTDGGLMSWKPTWVGIRSMAGRRRRHFQTGLEYVFGYPAVLVVICIRLLCSILYQNLALGFSIKYLKNMTTTTKIKKNMTTKIHTLFLS